MFAKWARVFIGDHLLGVGKSVRAWTTLAISYQDGNLVGMVDDSTNWVNMQGKTIGQSIRL